MEPKIKFYFGIADRTPSTGLMEYKKVVQPVSFECVDVKKESLK